MRSCGCWLILAGALAWAATPARAEKKWQGQVTHPPVLGDGLSGARVIFGPVSGRCALEFVDLLRHDLIANGVTVVADADLAALIAQHHLAISLPLADASAELAGLLGPSDLVSIDISRCEALPREPMLGSRLPAMHISRTEGHFLASLRVTDVATGRALATQTLRADPGKQNESQTGEPEYPAPSDLLAMSIRQSIGQARRLYAPWTETQEITFLDDKDCNLRQSWELLKKGDYQGLLRSSRADAESCQVNAKTAAAAWYDLGVAYMLVQNYDAALDALGKSGKLHEIRQAEDLMNQCRSSKVQAEALAHQIVARMQDKPIENRPVETGILFTNDLVIRLVQGNVADEDIIRLIGSQPSHFALGSSDVEKLHEAGVPEPVIVAMEARQ